MSSWGKKRPQAWLPQTRVPWAAEGLHSLGHDFLGQPQETTSLGCSPCRFGGVSPSVISWVLSSPLYRRESCTLKTSSSSHTSYRVFLQPSCCPCFLSCHLSTDCSFAQRRRGEKAARAAGIRPFQGPGLPSRQPRPQRRTAEAGLCLSGWPTCWPGTCLHSSSAGRVNFRRSVGCVSLSGAAAVVGSGKRSHTGTGPCWPLSAGAGPSLALTGLEEAASRPGLCSEWQHHRLI